MFWLGLDLDNVTWPQTDEILSRAPLVLKHVPMSSMQRYWTSNVAKAKTYSEIPV